MTHPAYPPDGFIYAYIDSRYELRKIDRIEMEPGYIMSGRSNPYYIKRHVPITYEGERVQWIAGSDIPRIINTK